MRQLSCIKDMKKIILEKYYYLLYNNRLSIIYFNPKLLTLKLKNLQKKKKKKKNERNEFSSIHIHISISQNRTLVGTLLSLRRAVCLKRTAFQNVFQRSSNESYLLWPRFYNERVDGDQTKLRCSHLHRYRNGIPRSTLLPVLTSLFYLWTQRRNNSRGCVSRGCPARCVVGAP